MHLNLLVIGNGFDLAHGLKTTYTDFLHWANDNQKMLSYDDFNLAIYWRKRMGKRETRDQYMEDYVPGFAGLLFEEKDNWIDKQLTNMLYMI
jgi:hypothetical protein